MTDSSRLGVEYHSVVSVVDWCWLLEEKFAVVLLIGVNCYDCGKKLVKIIKSRTDFFHANDVT